MTVATRKHPDGSAMIPSDRELIATLGNPPDSPKGTIRKVVTWQQMLDALRLTFKVKAESIETVYSVRATQRGLEIFSIPKKGSAK